MKVSVLMPAFNAERYISEAIESVLSQTHTDFELIIIDDGSTDNTLSVAESYAQKDGRVKVISHPNVGMGTSLNRALDLANNEWVARMDADDIMLPNRIERQIAFIKENADVAIAGTFVHYINNDGTIIGKQQSPYITRDHVEELVQRNKLVGFTHPSVIMRKSVVKEVGGYRGEFWPADDIDLWNRIVERDYTVLAQPEYLLKYRKHGSSAYVSRQRLSQLKTNWVKACVQRRRSGKPEPTWEKFLALRQQAPWWDWLNEERKLLAKSLYNVAVLHFSMRKYHLCAPILLCAALLQPRYILGQMKIKSARSAFNG